MNNYRMGDLVEVINSKGDLQTMAIGSPFKGWYFCIDINTLERNLFQPARIMGYTQSCKNFKIGQKVKIAEDLSKVASDFCDEMLPFENSLVTIHHFAFHPACPDDGNYCAVINEDEQSWSWWLKCLTATPSKMRTFLAQMKNE